MLRKEAAGKWGMRGWSCARSRASSWDGPPSKGVPGESEVLDVSSQKEFSERQSDK